MPVGCIRSLTAAKEERERKKERKEGREIERDSNDWIKIIGWNPFFFSRVPLTWEGTTHIYIRAKSYSCKVLFVRSLIRAKQDAAERAARTGCPDVRNWHRDKWKCRRGE